MSPTTDKNEDDELRDPRKNMVQGPVTWQAREKQQHDANKRREKLEGLRRARPDVERPEPYN